MPERMPSVLNQFQDNLTGNYPPMPILPMIKNMSKDQSTAIYRWIIGGMIATIAYFAMKIDRKVDVMYESHVQQHLIDREQTSRIERVEVDVESIRRHPAFISATRSSTLFNQN
jgi:hypothetical protein